MVKKDQFFPDYTPFSFDGSAHADGDRYVHSKFKYSMGCGFLVLLIVIISFIFFAF